MYSYAGQYAFTYCGIIRLRGGSIFIVFVGTSHPRINEFML